jgi:TfoX/Sxy family transcriptional regulator of competence genes
MPKKPANPVAADLMAQLDRKLAPLGHLATRRMFSGYAAYLDGTVFALILRGKLWLRVDDQTRPDYIKAGMKPFAYTKPSSGKTVRIESYECPAAILGDAAKLRRWAREARRASAERNRAKPKKKKSA